MKHENTTQVEEVVREMASHRKRLKLTPIKLVGELNALRPSPDITTNTLWRWEHGSFPNGDKTITILRWNTAAKKRKK